MGSTNGAPNPMRPVGALCVTEMEVVGYKKCVISKHFARLVAKVAPLGLIFLYRKCVATHMSPLTGATHISPLLGLPKCRP